MRATNLIFQQPIADDEGNRIAQARELHHAMCTQYAEFNSFQAFFPPLFVSAETDARFARLVEDLRILFMGFLHRLIARDGIDAVLNRLGYSPTECAMLLPACTPSWFDLAGALLRFDFLATDHGLKVVELNAAAGIGGIGTMECYDQAFASNNYAHILRDRKINVHTGQPFQHFHGLILRLVNKQLDDNKPINVVHASLPRDLPHVWTKVSVDHLARTGLQVTAMSVFDIDVRADGVYANGERVHMVWGVYSFEAEASVPELRAKTMALLKAAEAGQVAYLAPPSASILGSKALIALMTSERDDALFNEDEQALIEQVLPRTVIVREDTIDALYEQQQSILLKPARGISGLGILVGPAVSAAAWRLALQKIVASRTPFVAQALCKPLAVPVQTGTFDADGTEAIDVAMGGICIDGHYAGNYLRAQPAGGGKPINVAHGGKLAPCYVFERT